MSEADTNKSEKPTHKPLHPKMEAKKFKKGYTPWNKGKKMPKKEKPMPTSASEEKQNMDTKTVKIQVVKVEPIETQKNFTYDKDAYAERICTRFLNSIIANRPQKVEIDNLTYYSTDFVKGIIRQSQKLAVRQNEKYEDLEKENTTLKKELDFCMEIGAEICDKAETISNDNSRLHKSNQIWKGIVLGGAIGLVLIGLIKFFAKSEQPLYLPPTPPVAIELAK